jgi:uncharacterized protein YdhG (YjbR/CyaY superfamily)
MHTVPRTVNEYLSSVPKEHRADLTKLRRTIRSFVPKAEEVLSYRIPTFKLGKMLVAYAAFKEHCSFFPLSAAVLKTHRKELKGYETSKGTIRFPMDKPLSALLVKSLVNARIVENEERARLRVKSTRQRKPL